MYTCPKCGQAMQTYTRAGLQIEQCNSCRGVFLDAGELERIVQAEGQWIQQHYQQQAPPPPMAPGHQAPLGGAVLGHMVGHGHHRHHSYGHKKGHRKHTKSFLGEIFDM